MHKRPVTWTGRGLRLASLGEIILATTAVLYLLSRSGRLAAIGFFVAGFVGLLSIQRMWSGRNEFGPDHAKNTKWALGLFFAAAFLFVYAFLASLSNVPETLRVRDLRPPVVGVALALICETASGGLLLRELCGSHRRRWVIGYVALGGALGILLFWRGMVAVTSIEKSDGSPLLTPEQAAVRLRYFFADYLPWVMAAFLVTRLAAYYLVKKAREEVDLAEHDAMEKEQASPPPTVAATDAVPPSP